MHDAAWRDAYRGVIPGREFERMIARRGPPGGACDLARQRCWSRLRRRVAGYVSYGRNRVPALSFGGEIFELYLAPECRARVRAALVRGARKDLADHGYPTFLVWALADNERAMGVYAAGRQIVRRAPENFGGEEGNASLSALGEPPTLREDPSSAHISSCSQPWTNEREFDAVSIGRTRRTTSMS